MVMLSGLDTRTNNFPNKFQAMKKCDKFKDVFTFFTSYGAGSQFFANENHPVPACAPCPITQVAKTIGTGTAPSMEGRCGHCGLQFHPHTTPETWSKTLVVSGQDKTYYALCAEKWEPMTPS